MLWTVDEAGKPSDLYIILCWYDKFNFTVYIEWRYMWQKNETELYLLFDVGYWANYNF